VVRPPGHDPGKIMALLPLSGPLKDEGLAARRGMELAFKDAGIEVSLYYVDWERENILSYVSERSFGVFFVQLPFSEILKIVERRPDAVIIAPTSSHEGLKELSQVFSFVATDGEEGKYVASLVKGTSDDVSSFVIVLEPDGYGSVLYSAFEKAWDSGKAPCRVVKWKGGQDEPCDEIKSVIAGKPRVIWLSGSPQWINQVYSRIMSLGYSGFFLVPSYFDQHMARRVPPGYLNRFIFVRPCVGDPEYHPWNSFFERFKRKFLRAPEWIDSLFYDAATVYASYVKSLRLRKTGPSVTVADFRAFLGRQEYFEGVSGIMRFSQEGRVSGSFHLALFKGGMFVPATNSICESSGLKGCSRESANTSGKDK